MVKATVSVSTKTAKKPKAKGSRPSAQPQPQTHTEASTRHFLGPVSFTLSDLQIVGTSADWSGPAPEQSSSIIAADEPFLARLNLTFNKSPLTALLMGLGTQITVNLHVEGQGRSTTELDLTATLVTEPNEFAYDLELEDIPSDLDLEPGLYAVSTTVEIGPAAPECSQAVLGYGYLAKVMLQVHPAVS